MPELPEEIYLRPNDYDLEHVGDTTDVEFFVSLATRLQPKRVLELACGNGRVTVPLAEAGAQHGFEVVGIELVPKMLEAAQQKAKDAAPAAQKQLTLLEGDIRSWCAEQPFDLILTPCSSMCHLLTLEDQLAAWRTAYENLRPGGRSMVDVTMPDLSSYADRREWLEIDLDSYDEASQTRLIRYRTTHYLADEQRACIRFLYDKYVGNTQPQRSLSDFQSHVYYPREMRLLYMHTGFEVEEVYGDYQSRPLKPTSPQMIFSGIKPT